MLRRNWPLLSTLVLANGLLRITLSIPRFERTIVSLVLGYVVASSIFCVCARLFRESLPPPSRLAIGMAVSLVLPAFLLGLLLRVGHGLQAPSFVFVAWRVGLLAGYWALLKLSAAPAMFLLGNTWEQPVDALAASWGFVAGFMWWKFLGIVVVATVVLIAAVAPMRFAIVHLHLGIASWLLGGLIEVAWSSFLALAILRLASGAAHLHARYASA